MFSEQEWLSRTSLLMGNEKLSRLAGSHVLVVGLGGVGAYAAEQICRSGVGKMTIVDGDIVQPSNRNRQLAALVSTEGDRKSDIVGARLLDINPRLQLTVINEFLRHDRISEMLDQRFDFVVDAIDTLAPKVHLISECVRRGINIVSSMGAGGKMDPSQVMIADISESYNCRLAFYIRKRLHRMGIYKGFKVVYSPEPVDPGAVRVTPEDPHKRSMVGTVSYMPALFGCYCASVAVRGLIEA